MLLLPSLLWAGPNRGKKLRLDLGTAVRVGIANNFALIAARNRKVALKELITERWRAYLPSVGVSYSRTRDINQDAADVLSHEIRLNIEQVLYDGGRRNLDLDLAKIDAILARSDIRILLNRLRLDIQRAYLRVLAASGKIDLNQKSLERARLQLKQVRLEEKVGLATRVQVLTVASRVREIELAMRQAANEYRQANHDLKLALNLDFEVDLVPTGDLFRDFVLNPPRVNVKSMLHRARALRPEIKRSLTNIHRLKKEKQLAVDSWIPRISVNAFVGRQGERFPIRQRSWGVNFSLTFPIGSTTSSSNAGTGVERDRTSARSNTSTSLQFFDDLSYDRRVLESKVALGEALTQHRQLYNQLAIEVIKSYDGLRESWESIRIGNGRVYFRYESLRIINTRYKVGEIKREDIVLAETELVRAQEDLTDAIARYITSAYELEFAAGLDPGTLPLFLYRPGKGNSLLSRIILGGPVKQTKIPRADTPALKKNEPGTNKKKKPGYLLDDVKLK